MIALPASTALCPACKGRGNHSVKHAYVGAYGKRSHRNDLVRCVPCRGRGRVEAERVCPQCGLFLDACQCLRVEPHRAEYLRVLRPRPKRQSVEAKLIPAAAPHQVAQREINAVGGVVDPAIPLTQKDVAILDAFLQKKKGGGESRMLVSRSGSTVSAELSAPQQRLQRCPGWGDQPCGLHRWWGDLWRCGLCAGFEVDESE
jgi:hypothetical protein